MRQTLHICGQEIGRPGHICAFFDSRTEEYDTVLPFLRDGVEDGEEVLSVVDASRLADHRERLALAGIGDSDLVTVGTSEDTYVANGRFDMEQMVEFVAGHLEAAAGRGRRVRTAGWMDWIHREVPGAERVLEYEARMNLLFPEFDSTFVCVYDLSKLSGRMVVDVMATHPWVILKGEIRRNAFYVEPGVYLEKILGGPPRTHVR